MERPADITVVIPTRNRSALLERSLRGALDQDGVDVEVIVVDDGSSDATGAMLSAHRDPRVRTITHTRSKGVAAARNHGVRRARSDWIALLDDDDVWAPNKLRVQLEAARKAGADFAYSAAAYVGAELRMIWIEPAPDPESLRMRLLSNNVVPAGASNVIVRRRLLIELGGFDESLFHMADWDLWIRLAQRATGVACDEVLLAYVMHSDNMLGRQAQGVFDELARFVAKHRETSRAHGHEIDRVGVARWVAMTHRRAGRRANAAAAYLQAVRFGDRRRSFGSLLRTISESDRHESYVQAKASAPQEPEWLELFREPHATAA